MGVVWFRVFALGVESRFYSTESLKWAVRGARDGMRCKA